MLDRLNDSVSKKVDIDQLRSGVTQTKSDMQQQIELLRNELSMDRTAKDQRIQERLDKNEVNGERALDEIFSYKEQLRLL